VDVALVYWPAEAERLARLRAARQPRLVMVAQGPPPTTIDALEDWLRVPANDSDIRIRLATLRERAARSAPTVSIEDGVLRVGIRLVVLPPIEARIAAALVEHVNSVVGREALVRCAWPDGAAPAGRTVLDVHMAKLRRLLRGTGIDIRTVHGRGYFMDLSVPDHERATES
jgi:DNA-binding response OmpR family regulator